MFLMSLPSNIRVIHLSNLFNAPYDDIYEDSDEGLDEELDEELDDELYYELFEKLKKERKEELHHRKGFGYYMAKVLSRDGLHKLSELVTKMDKIEDSYVRNIGAFRDDFDYWRFINPLELDLKSGNLEDSDYSASLVDTPVIFKPKCPPTLIEQIREIIVGYMLEWIVYFILKYPLLDYLDFGIAQFSVVRNDKGCFARCTSFTFRDIPSMDISNSRPRIGGGMLDNLEKIWLKNHQ